jgi:hypothetical protein
VDDQKVLPFSKIIRKSHNPFLHHQQRWQQRASENENENIYNIGSEANKNCVYMILPFSKQIRQYGMRNEEGKKS